MRDLWLPPEDRLALWEPVGAQVRVIGWRPGPAGVSALELAEGLTVVVDHASPTTLAEVAVDLRDGRVADDHLPLLEHLLGGAAVDDLQRLPGTRGGARPTPLRGAGDRYGRTELDRFSGPDRDPSDVAGTFARVALAADLGEDERRSDGARAVALLEAAAGASALGLRALVPGLVGRSVELLESAPPGFDAKFAHRVAGLAATVARDAGDLLGERLRRATDPMAGAGRAARPAAAPAPRRVAETDTVFGAVAAMAAPRSLDHLRTPDRQDVMPLEVDGDHGAWAGLTGAGHVVVRTGRRAEDAWARVFRRSDRLLLGLAPLRPAGDAPQLEATVVVPRTHPADLLVDVVTDPSSPRRSPVHDATREAVLAGRTAARLSRRGDGEADAAWAITAARWHQLGDVQRANLAERHGRRDDRTGRGRARFRATPPLLADEVD